MREINETLFFASFILLIYLVVRISLAKKVKFNLINDSLRVVLVTYIGALIFIVLITGTSPANYILYNFVPFRTIIQYWNGGLPEIAFKNIIGNIIITMPLGFFAYVKWRALPGTYIILLAICISGSIELAQFLMYLSGFGTRSIDIDDVILNSLGMLLGYVLTRFALEKIFKPTTAGVLKR